MAFVWSKTGKFIRMAPCEMQWNSDKRYCLGSGKTNLVQRFCRANARMDFRVWACEYLCECSREVCVFHDFRSKKNTSALVLVSEVPFSRSTELHPTENLFAASGCTLRQELFAYVVDNRRPTDNHVGLCRNPALRTRKHSHKVSLFMIFEQTVVQNVTSI